MQKKVRGGKRGISPVIATVLLIAIVLVTAVLIFVWVRGFIKEVDMKFGKSAMQVCEEINLDISLNGQELSIINNGNVPIYGIDVQGEDGSGTVIPERINEVKLSAGSSNVYTLSGTYTKIRIIPTILSEVKNSKKEHPCDNLKIEVEQEGAA